MPDSERSGEDALLAALFDDPEILLVLLDDHFQPLRLNAAAEVQLPASASATDFWERISCPDGREIALQILKSGRAGRCASRWPNDAGAVCSVEWRLTRLDEASSASPCLLLRGYSVAAEESANRDQQAQLAQIRAMADRLPVGVFWAGLDGEMVFANATAHSLAGLSHSSVEATDWSNAVHPEDRSRTKRAMQFAQENHLDYYCEHRFVHKNGKVQWVLSRSTQLLNERGEVTGRVGTYTDLTEAKNRERLLRTARDEARAASAANEQKSVFLRSMSHELRTPLNAILGLGQLLELRAAQKLDEKENKQLQGVIDAGEHMLALIEQFLDYGTVDAGRVKLSFQRLFLDELLERVGALVQPLAEKARVSLNWDRSAVKGLHVYADRTRFQQVLFNLVSNAIKFNRTDGSGTVSLSCVLMPQGRVRLLVSDNGCGISAESQKRLFMPFERLGKEGSAIPGSGLGLNISQSLVQLMHGAIGAESKEGVGSTFWIEMPTSEQD